MTYVTADRFIADAKRTCNVLNALLEGVSDDEARSLRDGADGWNIVEVVCHLRDFDGFFQTRAEMMLSADNPELPAFDHEALAIVRAYQSQSLRQSLNDLFAHRAEFLALFESLTDEQWKRAGIHPENGTITVFDSLIQLTHHDLTHLEQIGKCLRRVQAFS